MLVQQSQRIVKSNIGAPRQQTTACIRRSSRPVLPVARAAHFPLGSHDGGQQHVPQPRAALQQQEQELGDQAASGCPFLASLRSARMVEMPWAKRVALQVLDPAHFQAEVLCQRGIDTIVQGPKVPGFSAFHMPANHQLVKEVFAAEAAGSVTQGLAETGGYRAFATLLGDDCLLVVKDPGRHKQLRSLMAPAFSADAIVTYLPDIQALVGSYLSRWQAAGPAGVSAHREMKALTFEFIMQVVMGRNIPQSDLDRLSGLFSSLTAGLLAWPYWDLPFTPWNRALRARAELVRYFQNGVSAARSALARGEAVPGVLGMLVSAEDDAGVRLSDAELTSNLLLVLLAGHDTSSTTLTRTLSNLQDNPWVVERLRAEQERVVAKHGSVITPASLRDMPFADAVIRETLRRDPVVGAVMRVVTSDLALDGYSLPAGTTLLLPLRYLADNEPRWQGQTGSMDPSVFNPDRLLTPEGSRPGQLMPFGAGVRHCLGAGLAMAEMKICLALLAREYEFCCDNQTDWKPALGYIPANGLPMVVQALQAV